MESDGLFISIEGPDASGKHTQYELLIDRLRNPREDDEHAPKDVYAQDFPAYDETEYGRKLGQYLHGELDIELSDRELSQWYIKDREEKAPELQTALENGEIVVTDRYSQSNWAYQTADKASEERWAFIDWLRSAEAHIPQPDVIIYMDMPVAQSQELMAMAGKVKDRNEADVERMENVVAAYHEIAEREDWIVIDPMTDAFDGVIDGTAYLRPPEVIHEDVWDAIEEYVLDRS